MIFKHPFRFGFLVHRLLPTLRALRLDFAATIRRFSVFGLTSNMLVKRYSAFLALGFLTGVYFVGILVLLSVNPYGVDTIAASITSLRVCWSSHVPTC